MSTLALMTRRLRGLTLGLLALCQAVSAYGQDQRPQIEKADALLKKGKYEKAREAFIEIDRVAAGRSVDALIGLARASSELGQHPSAHEALSRLLAQVEPGAARVWAQGELVHAVALGGLDDRSGLERGLAEVRDFLAERPLGAFSRGLRIRVCAARGHLAEDDELGFTDRVLDPATGRNLQGDAIRPLAPAQYPQRIAGEMPSFGGTIPGSQHLVAGLLIDRDGCVVDVQVLSTTLPEWSSVVGERAREWVFEPPVIEGEVKPVYYTLTVNHSSE